MAHGKRVTLTGKYHFALRYRTPIHPVNSLILYPLSLYFKVFGGLCIMRRAYESCRVPSIELGWFAARIAALLGCARVYCIACPCAFLAAILSRESSYPLNVVCVVVVTKPFLTNIYENLGRSLQFSTFNSNAIQLRQ